MIARQVGPVKAAQLVAPQKRPLQRSTISWATPHGAPDMDADQHLRKHLIELLHGGSAHASFDDAVADLPPALRGKRPAHAPFTPWRLVEHMRLAQRDILDFSRGPDHESPDWPEGYWPPHDAPPNAAAWDRSLAKFREDQHALVQLVRDRHRKLLEPFPWGAGQTLAREVMLAADHNAYHIAQLILVRRLLGAWRDG